MKKPNHHQPMQGDSDDTDLRDIITRCAAVLEDEELKFGGFEEIDFESIWELDKKSIENYSKLQAKKPDYTSVALQNSGNFYLRDSFDEKGNYLWFTCGSIGSGHGYSKLQAKKPDYTSVALQNSGNFYLRDSFDEKGNYLWFTCGSIGSGHGHGDMLHFDLTYKGEDFLIDSGRYTYVEGNETRIELKNKYSHNTIIMDKQLFSKFNVTYKGEDFLIDSGRYTYVEGNETRIELKNKYSHNTIIMDKQLFSKFNVSWGIGKTPIPLNSMYKFNDKFDYVEGGHLGREDI